MKHLGDITKINGAEIEPVWCITGGSPCQDLSVAGKRAGLKHADRGDFETTRSGLLMEQVRIVKEMREHDRRTGRTGEMVRPRFLVWENVPGAFSSNFRDGYGDFGAVLEEIVRIAEPAFSLPRLQDKQKWTKAGAIDGDGWSVAWRTHDAQYWGVPQRRRRISVVADFGGQRAGEILFELESLPGHPDESQQAGEEATGHPTYGAGADDCGGIGINGNIAASIDASYYKGCGMRQGIEREVVFIESGGNKPAVLLRNFTYQDVTGCLSPGAHPGSYNGQDAYNDMLVTEPKFCQNTGVGWWNQTDVGATLRTPCGSDATKANLVCEPTVYDMTHANDVIRDCGAVSPTLQNRMGTGGNQVPLTVQRIIRWIVRRLTPMECERLQGYPDHWTDIGDWVDSKGKKHKGDADSPRYKALGNSIALPFWYWMFCRMEKFLPENATLGSLFDGIGGFPLCWEAIHGKGTARWASEIEEFPIAVTKIRFPEE